MRLNQVTVVVRDVARAIAFYKQLGLIQIVDSEHYARFRCPDGDATFSVERGETAPSETMVYFECDDLDQRFLELSRLGIQFDLAPTDQPWLWREARFRDPDGNRLCLFSAGENRLAPPWKIA
jgi:catechol 2,3-dioxygenase-like lactoylglutathione lyase family enzyme